VGNQVAGTLDPAHFKSYGPDIVAVEAWLNDKNRHYLARGESFPHIGWTLNVLIDEEPAKSAQYNTFLIAALIGLVLAALALLLLQRRQAFLMRLDAERTTAGILEQTVAQRTSELRGTNKKLQIEFDERVAAEKALKQAQASLIQSAKLAAIGQMSTALAHEYNQPLAAIRSYADNGRAFLKRGNKKELDENLVRIAKMTERMAALSGTLKTFARKPRTKLQLVPVFALLEEAMVLVGPEAKKQDVKLHLQPNDSPISVMAGQVRLSQVVVNLLSNAIDAVAGSKKREVYLSAQFNDDLVKIYVEDTGPGVPVADRHKIFDAFVTSKDVGEGLGLGLSIAYNIVHDFGGEISVGPGDRGGAVFMVSLPGQLATNLRKAKK
jgi:two-component system C4-dicarboxylate transport sensor histidine kinase DctB